MGGGTYCSTSRALRSEVLGYTSASRHEIFSQSRIHKDMDPSGVQLRESRDSDEHPNSVPVIIALDVTGSMGEIPHYFVKEGLPNIMEKLFQAGIKDPQVMFMAIGDHECDNAPLQIGQFESNDQMLDKWLTDVWLEGRGGANEGESYHLAWYFAGYHTSLDCFEKRGKKGFLFTIGDEPILMDLPSHSIDGIMGAGQHGSHDARCLLDKARETFDVFHIHMASTSSGSHSDRVPKWHDVIGVDSLLIAQSSKDVVDLIVHEVVSKEGTNLSEDEVVDGTADNLIEPSDESPEEML